MQKSIEDFDASTAVMRANIDLYHSGVRDAYRVVAVELRKLLCDRNSLIPRLFEGFRPHKLNLAGLLEAMPGLAEGLVMYMPFVTEFDGKGGHRSRLSFHRSQQKTDLEHLLDQPFMSKSVTVRELIRSVADKEGAHSDPQFNDTLAFTHSIHLVADRSTQDAIVAIGEYVLEYLEREPLKRRWS